MTSEEKDKAKAAAAASVGAGVGGAGGATAGVLELAAQGILSGLSASLVIGAGAAIGALAGYGAFRLLKKARGADGTAPRASGTGVEAPGAKQS